MKTTVDLPESLLTEAKTVAERRGWTVRLVFEESLRAFLQQDDQRSKDPMRLNHSIVRGEQAPTLSLSQMLETTGINRLPE